MKVLTGWRKGIELLRNGGRGPPDFSSVLTPRLMIPNGKGTSRPQIGAPLSSGNLLNKRGNGDN